jgi:cell division protein ZapA (FtsZ GTPase activity inhibitor)
MPLYQVVWLRLNWKLSLSFNTDAPGDKFKKSFAKQTTTSSGDTSATVNTATSSSASHLTSFDNFDTQLYNLQSRNTRLSLKLSLLESRTALITVNTTNHERETDAIVVHDLSDRMARLEMSSDRQNKINQTIVATLSPSDEEDKEEAMTELVHQRIKTKHRIRQKQRLNRPNECEEVPS